MKDIERKGDLRLLGVTLNEETCNWDTHLIHFDHLISKASPRLYIYFKSLQILWLLFTGAYTTI